MTVSSEVEIYNLAFDRLGEASATSPDDDDPLVRRMRANYAQTRDKLLRAHPWRFAMARTALAALEAAPAFGWKYQYERPVKAIRIMPLTKDGEFDGYPIPHRFEGTRILTDEKAPLRVRYIRSDVSPPTFDPLFVELLKINLAMSVAYRMTTKRSLVEDLKVEARQLMSMATMADSLEGTSETAQGDYYLEAGFPE